MHHVDSPWLVPFDGSFRVSRTETKPPKDADEKKSAHKKRLKKLTDELRDLQEVLYAHDAHSVLLVFQALDAAGKDGTIRAVMSGVNPAGCQVYSFKAPSKEELDHDFLWRTSKCLPERGRIGVFNRSYYEETLVVRVHPEYLGGQRIPDMPPLDELWEQRFESIRAHEQHLAQNGTMILKFWLNVSRDEQRDRLLARIDDPKKNWKFNSGDVEEREHWDAYMHAFEETLNATSRPWAPWYAVPADDKPYMRCEVSDLIVRSLKALPLSFPTLSAGEKAELGQMREILASQ